MNNANQSMPNSPLVTYALRGLERCWLPDHGRWSHVYHLDNRQKANESLPRSDVFYTLNVLLGISRLNEIPNSIDVSTIFERNVAQLERLPVPKYALGMALWAAAELKLDVPFVIIRHLERLLSDERNWWSLRAQDLGMILTGIVAQAKVHRKDLYPFADRLLTFLLERYYYESGLFCDGPSGVRRRFGSFASQIYLAFASYCYGELANKHRAIEVANSCVRKLIELQGPRGEWPWLFDAKRGLVVDFYEVYSVHQYGMAPALLECAERHGVPNASEALIKGFEWIFGDNQLAEPMLVPELHLTIRSQVRSFELHTKNLRMLRAIHTAVLGRGAKLTNPKHVRLRLECRSYELGWILWSFGQRSDLHQLTHNQIFIDALQKPRNFAAYPARPDVG